MASKEETYLKLQPVLEQLNFSESQQKHFKTFLNDLDKVQSIDGLENDVVQFTEVVGKLESFDAENGMKLISIACNIFLKVKDANQVTSILYMVVIAGMNWYNQQPNGDPIESILQKLIEDQSDKELIRECEGVKSQFKLDSTFLSAMTGEALADHEINIATSCINTGAGIKEMGKLASRIAEMRDAQHGNYCNRRNPDLKQLLKFIEVYCWLANMKYGIWAHFYSLLQLSGTSPRIAKAIKHLIDDQRKSDRKLLEFMVYPSKNTAIIHYLGDIESPIIPRTFLKLHEILPRDLSFLCEGQYRLSSVKYDNSRLYMATLFKIVRWDNSLKEHKSKFSFKKANGDSNVFQINSECFPGYHLTQFVKGFWVEGSKESSTVEKKDYMENSTCQC